MWKAVLAGSTALALLGTTMVYAQQRPGRGPDGQRGPSSMEDIRAFGDARLAALKAGLTLTAEQEKNWPAFEQAARELAKLRFDRMATQRERIAAQREARRSQEQKKEGEQQQTQQTQQQTPPDPIERMRRRGTAMAETGTALKKLADATDPLYKSLDDAQKRRFAILNRLGGGRDGRPGFRGRDQERQDGERRGHRRGELTPGQDQEQQSGPDRRGSRREGFERGQRRGTDRGVENL